MQHGRLGESLAYASAFLKPSIAAFLARLTACFILWAFMPRKEGMTNDLVHPLVYPFSPAKTGTIEYVPPTADILQKFAVAACQRMAERGYAALNTPTAISEFTAFLKVASKIQCELLNKKTGEPNGR
jgi:hypothetical protein